MPVRRFSRNRKMNLRRFSRKRVQKSVRSKRRTRSSKRSRRNVRKSLRGGMFRNKKMPQDEPRYVKIIRDHTKLKSIKIAHTASRKYLVSRLLNNIKTAIEKYHGSGKRRVESSRLDIELEKLIKDIIDKHPHTGTQATFGRLEASILDAINKWGRLTYLDIARADDPRYSGYDAPSAIFHAPGDVYYSTIQNDPSDTDTAADPSAADPSAFPVYATII